MAIPGIQEIQALATKYSKPQLQKMAQMGLVDPTKAVMAGMMIDRIQQQNMQPPQQTVAEEVMGAPPPPPMAGGAPEGAPPPGGIAGLPSNLPPQMAGGGIVAFADGGDTEGYADGGAVRFDKGGSAGIIDVVDPNWTSSKSFKRNYTNDDKFAILAEQLAQLTAAERQAQGLDKVRIQKDIAELQSTMRGIKAGPAAKSLVDQIPLPAAGAEDLPPIKPVKQDETSSAAGRAVKKLFGQSEKTAEQAKAYQSGLETYDNRILDVSKRIGELSGPLGMRQQTPEQQAEYDQLIKDRQVLLNARNNLAQDISKSGEKPTTPEDSAKKFDVVPVEPKPVAKAEEKEADITRPELPPVRQMDVPAEAKFTDQYDQVRQAYTQAGIDVDLYKKLSDEIKEKKAGGASKRDVALGHAMMAFGFELFGARKGEFASKLSGAGQKSLYQYMSNMDKITENEEKLDALDRQVRLAEQQFKLTGADTALRRTENLNDKRTAIINKNVELAQNSDQLRANLAASLYNVDKTFQARMDANAVKIMAAMGNSRGGFTDKQLVDLRAQMEIQHGPALRELNKNKGSKEQIEKIVADEINQKVLDEVNRVRGIRQSGGIPVPSNAQNWQVTGGMD